MCDQLAWNLNREFGASAIHGDKKQQERDFVLAAFKVRGSDPGAWQCRATAWRRLSMLVRPAGDGIS
jgi:hypothetical protein